MNHYLLTIRKHNVKEYVSPDEIYSAIMYLKLRIPTLYVVYDCYEIDSTYLQLHYHAWVTTNERIYYSQNSKYNDFRLYWRRLGNNTTNICDVIRYIEKQDTDKIRRSQLFDENYYRHHYAF